MWNLKRNYTNELTVLENELMVAEGRDGVKR